MSVGVGIQWLPVITSQLNRSCYLVSDVVYKVPRLYTYKVSEQTSLE